MLLIATTNLGCGRLESSFKDGLILRRSSHKVLGESSQWASLQLDGDVKMKGHSGSVRAVLVHLWLGLALIGLLSSAASVSVPANSSLGTDGSDSTDVDATL